MVTGSVGTIGGATAGIVTSVKSLGNGKKEDIKESSVASTDISEPGSTNTGSKSGDTNTEPDTDPKPNKLNKNEKSNNLKKAGIGSGVVIILLLVYVAICRNRESMLKNEVIKTIKRCFIGSPMSMLGEGEVKE